MNPHAPSKPKVMHGFSLLEALVAMAIAAIAFATLYRSVGQSSLNATTTEARVQAALVANTVLATATYAEELALHPSGDNGPWHWTIQITPQPAQLQPTNAAAVPLTLAQISINVSRQGQSTLNWTAYKPYRSAP